MNNLQYLSCTLTDRWARPWGMCTLSMGLRGDCTEAFLSTTFAASPPKLWPSPPMNSWSRSSTWTSRCVCTWTRENSRAWMVYIRMSRDLVAASWTHQCGNGFFPLSHWRHRGSELMAEVIVFHCVCALLLPPTPCLCDSPPLKLWFTQLHDMWFEYEQIPHQCLHGYSGVVASLVRVRWWDWLGATICS